MFSLLLLTGVVGLRFVSGQIAGTSAICLSDYSWMGNSKSSSPCQVVAQLNSQCNNGVWLIPAINYTVRYSIPNTTEGTATPCTCSWASYNLISACTTCQGYADFIADWGYYISNCNGKTTDNNYWPPLISIPTDVKIPYWASTDPTTWSNKKFSQAEAKKIYQASHPDLPTPTSSPSPSKPTPIGAIVGGALGGLAVIAVFIFCVGFLIRRHRRAMRNTTHPNGLLAHSRKTSDTTATSGMTLRESSSLRPMVQTSSTNVQRSTSISSLPFFSTFMGRDSRATGEHTPLPQDPPLEEVITPFTLPRTNDTPEKKHTEGEWPVFDQPSAPPQNAVRMYVLPSQTPPKKIGTTRFNPPAYSESDTATPISRHQNQDSIDSNSSTPLATEATDSIGRRGVHTPANSGSSMAQMGMSNPVRTSTSTFQTIRTSFSTRRTSGGDSMSPGFRRSHFPGRSQDTEESFSPTEIA